ncbi:hypothetical protein B2J88_22005 [Rhodococcus sp. SRB_17]|uniref:hypothetical protein n=1 Tax=Acidovorax sp. SRB_24 TaxID=1962700 RepID=UPI00145E8769|nr:hypothetical protein [Acidovorax sp. SRB_24]NMM78277.1 hypothetical protein [Acidovorax sp. SRB_24]NMM87008.1 hypothetical protein [Rhodococcus sp. SRB_17]
MTKIRSLYGVAAGVALVALLGTGTAQARDVNWSIGVSSPGIAVGVGNAYPVYSAPAPVYYAPPRPVYYAPPQPVYYAPPRPVYYAPAVVVGPPAYGYYREGWRGHRHGHRH